MVSMDAEAMEGIMIGSGDYGKAGKLAEHVITRRGSCLGQSAHVWKNKINYVVRATVLETIWNICARRVTG